MRSVKIRTLLRATSSFFLGIVAIPLLTNYSVASGGTLTVSGTQSGVTSQYLGANEGSSQFSINDLLDLGINSYRLYGGMSRWEPTNAESTYGSPSIAQIEANPAVINWAFYDNIFTNPPGGSDYSWSASTGIPPVSAATIIGDLNANNITPIIVLRNKDNNGNPAWSPNPPVTTNDWNVWWEHVFATVYWFNVRNNYVVDNWEVHNEPNNSGQGWAGTEAQYMTFVQYTADAIHWVYSNYLPGRTPHIYAPVTSNCCAWALSAMQTEGPSVFDSLDFHDYQSNPSEITTLRADMNANGYTGAPAWITEMGSYKQNTYNGQSTDNNIIVNWWIQASEPGNNYVNGVELFSLYDWGSSYTSGVIHGSYPSAETYTPGYYAMRIAARALVGGRPTYPVTSSIKNVLSVVTKDTSGHYYLIACNSGSPAATVTANLSALITTGTGTQWEFSSTNNDAIVGSPTLSNGTVTFTIPANATELLKF
jgi:hypothetical protein